MSLDDVAKLTFLDGGGECGRLIREIEWSDTPLGPAGEWPQALKTAVSLMLGSAQPVYVAWGPELISFYNDGYLPIVGTKHAAIGKPFFDLWQEIEDDFRPIVQATLRGQGQHFIDLPIALDGRPGVPIGYFTFSYTPLRSDTGDVQGIFVAATETTAQVLAVRERIVAAERQQSLLEQMPGFVCVLAGPKHRFEYVNDAYRELSGDRDFIGRTVREIFPDIEGQGFYELLDRSYCSGEPFSARAIPISLAKEDGERFIDLLYQPIRDDAGRVTGIFVGGYDVTERVRAEHALRLGETRLSALARASSDVMYRMSPDWGEMKELAGGGFLADSNDPSRAWLLGDIPESDRPRVTEAIERAIAAKAPFELEHRVVRADGSIGWTLSRAVPLFDAAGEIIEWFGAAADITARREAEERLIESEARFRAAQESSLDGFMILDAERGADGRIEDFRWRYANGAAERIIGKPSSWFIGRSMLEEMPGNRTTGLFDAYVAVVETGEPWSPEFSYTRDGVDLYLRAAVTKVDDGFAISFADLSERRRAEQRIERSEARFRLLTESIEEVFYLADLDAGVVAYVSPAYERLWGRPVASLYADITAYAAAIHPDDLPVAEVAFARQAEGHPTEVKYRIVRPDGTERWILDRSYPAREDGNRMAAGVAEDITARTLAEHQLHEFTSTLEQRVEERTAELQRSQEALRQSQKLEAMGQLTGGVAHDFNNLLTPIIGGLDLLQRRGVGDDRAQRLVEGALQSAERAKTLVQRLLAFARRQPLQPTAVDIEALVRGMADLIDSTTGPHVRIAVEVGENLPPARVDANQVEMALLNLAVNARDAMPNGGALTIGADVEDIAEGHRSGLGPATYILLSVTDTGEGMDAETAARAIEPFFSTKGVGKGTGLGLSMVHGLVAQLGGGLAISSERGIGTKVELWLPVAPVGSVAADVGAEPAAISRTGTALLVDDEELVRASTAEMLRDLDFSVVEAGSAEEALRLLRAGLSPDLVITDHLMPGLSGVDFVRTAREQIGDVPAILVSGYAEVEGIAADMPRLTKPFRRADLAAIIAEVLKPR